MVQTKLYFIKLFVDFYSFSIRDIKYTLNNSIDGYY